MSINSYIYVLIGNIWVVGRFEKCYGHTLGYKQPKPLVAMALLNSAMTVYIYTT